MKETDQLRKLMEAMAPDGTFYRSGPVPSEEYDLSDRNEPWEHNIEAFRRELKAFANELSDSHYREWLLQIVNDEGTQLMDKVIAFANELPDSHYSDWLLQIAKEYNSEIDEAQFDDEPFIQSQNLSGDDIIDRYTAGNISYEEAEVEIRQLHPDRAEATMLIAALNNAYGDKEVEWDEETGGGIVREDDADREWDIEFDNNHLTLFSQRTEEQVVLPIDDWDFIVKYYMKLQRNRQGPR